MSTYPNMYNETKLLKIKTRDDEIKNLKYRTEKHDHESTLKSPKFDNEYYKKKYKSLNKKKVLLNIIINLIRSASNIGCPTMRLIISGASNIFSSSTALLTSIAILSTNEYISNLKIRYTKLRDWIYVITLLYEKTLKTSMVDKKLMRKKHWNWKKYIIITLINEKKLWKILYLKSKMFSVML